MVVQPSLWFWILAGLVVLSLPLYLIEAYIRRLFPFHPKRHPSKEYYILNQLVVTGTAENIEKAIDLVKKKSFWQIGKVRITLETRLCLSSLGPGIWGCELPGELASLHKQVGDLPDKLGSLHKQVGELPDKRGFLQDQVIDLYKIRGLLPDVKRTIRKIEEILKDQGGHNLVKFEPNQLVGHPWEPEGSPWEPEGSPWEPEGSPLENLFGKRKKSQDAPAGLFMDQWAFDNIDLPAPGKKPTGEGVRVGIFDTSPFPDDDITLSAVGDEKEVGWVQVEPPSCMKLVARHATPRANLKRNSKRPIDVRNHGLFVAGMIHALAEASELYLIRVLQDDNRGDLFTLLEALFKFLKESLRNDNTLSNVVINLSLGIRAPDEEAEDAGIMPSAITALRYLLKAAHCLGAVIVAAAGNESSGLKEPADPNIPASWPETIGVAASNFDNQHACFSNKGVIYAPGGNGGTEACVPQAHKCDGDCEQAVIGPVLMPPAKTGFIYWTGSSFAAPMVSGLAALVIQAGNYQLSPAQVEQAILCGAQAAKASGNVNVINVPGTLQKNCMPKTQ